MSLGTTSGQSCRTVMRCRLTDMLWPAQHQRLRLHPVLCHLWHGHRMQEEQDAPEDNLDMDAAEEAANRRLGMTGKSAPVKALLQSVPARLTHRSHLLMQGMTLMACPWRRMRSRRRTWRLRWCCMRTKSTTPLQRRCTARWVGPKDIHACACSEAASTAGLLPAMLTLQQSSKSVWLGCVAAEDLNLLSSAALFEA